MIIDTHVHMGQFYDQYFSPEYISTLMQQCGVSFYVISSTTTCEENYEKVVTEIKKLHDLDGSRAIPCLWLTEQVLENEYYLSKLFAMCIWKCLKIHPSLHPEEWQPESSSVDLIFKIASKNRIPILIHTGDDDICCSLKYEMQIKSYPDVKVILAHGRPIEQSIYMCQTYSNVYIDTAFMPVKEICKLVRAGIVDKVLWGTDMFLPILYFPKTTPVKYYKEKLKKLYRKVSVDHFYRITESNAIKLFGIEI